MDRTTAQEKGIVEPEHIEIVQNNAAQLQPTHYRPQSDAEKRLDKKVNLKLDLIVVTLLAVEFIVSALEFEIGSWEYIADKYSSAGSTRPMSGLSQPAHSSKTPIWLPTISQIRCRFSRLRTSHCNLLWSSWHDVSA